MTVESPETLAAFARQMRPGPDRTAMWAKYRIALASGVRQFDGGGA